MQAPLCTDCHGEHKIIKPSNAASPVNAANIRETCGSCHGDVRLSRKFGMPSDRLVSFDASYHGLAAKEGVQTVANCASCHGIHNILASSDPNSTINPKNLPKTCGQCHPGAGQRFAIGQVHVANGASEPPVLAFIRQFYLLLIPVTIGLMLLHNGGDWIRKLVRARFHAGAPQFARRAPAGLRMLPFERVQHALLALSFMTLVWTGFALKYPDQWWARPLVLLAEQHNTRSLIHRVAASVFIAVSLTHLVSLIVSRKLRDHWKEMIPKVRDAREASSNFAYNLGLGDAPPPRSSHSYIEKAEYWAVIWGAVIMTASGVMLWANSLVMRLLPKLWLDVATSIHFYEAVLAALAIVVWHFYSIIFDPDVYPLNTAFLTGYIVKKDDPRKAADSHEQAAHEQEIPGD
jgi:cytochrome b subunit of formate dehydrogenase